MMLSKIKTIGYIFIHTILSQIIVISIFSFVCWLAYLGFVKYNYNTSIFPLLSILGFIAMMFSFICVSVFLKQFGVSVFSRSTRIPTDISFPQSSVTKIEYSYGPESIFTGERSVYVTKKEVKTAGAVAILCFPAIIIALTGVIKFIFETLRVLFSPRRQATWDESREDLADEIFYEGTFSFFKFPLICATSLLLILAISLSSLAIINRQCNPELIQFSISETDRETDSKGNTRIYYTGTLTNNGSSKVKKAYGILHFKNKNDELLFTTKMSMVVRTNAHEYLEKGESCNFDFYITFSQQELASYSVEDLALDDVKILFEVTSIVYKSYEEFEFSEKFIEVNTVLS